MTGKSEVTFNANSDVVVPKSASCKSASWTSVENREEISARPFRV